MASSHFDPQEKRWKCFFGLMHVRTATITLAIVGIIAGIISLIPILTCALMLYGVKRDRQNFIIPYLVMEIILIIVSIAAFIFCIYGLGYNDGIVAVEQRFRVELGLQPGLLDTVLSQYRGYEAPYGLLVAVVVCALISVAFNIYCCHVVCRTYTFIKEKKLATVTENAAEPPHVTTDSLTHPQDRAPSSRKKTPHQNSVHPASPPNHS